MLQPEPCNQIKSNQIPALREVALQVSTCMGRLPVDSPLHHHMYKMHECVNLHTRVHTHIAKNRHIMPQPNPCQKQNGLSLTLQQTIPGLKHAGPKCASPSSPAHVDSGAMDCWDAFRHQKGALVVLSISMHSGDRKAR